jgi:hypothetical protein
MTIKLMIDSKAAQAESIGSRAEHLARQKRHTLISICTFPHLPFSKRGWSPTPAILVFSLHK